MMFPDSPKDGEVYKHPNGHVYEYDSQTRSWDKTTPFETMTNTTERRTRKRPTALKEPSPTIEIVPISKEVDDVVS